MGFKGLFTVIFNVQVVKKRIILFFPNLFLLLGKLSFSTKISLKHVFSKKKRKSHSFSIQKSDYGKMKIKVFFQFLNSIYDIDFINISKFYNSCYEFFAMKAWLQCLYRNG